MFSAIRVAMLFLSLVASSAMAADASDRRFIREGMSDGEVIMKIGRADSKSTDTGEGAKVAVKRWIYFPAPGDSQTLTTLTIREGKVVQVSRQVSR